MIIDEINVRRARYAHQKIEKMFKVPLIISICMLAMAHGSNEINVSAPLAAELFLLDPTQTQIRER